MSFTFIFYHALLAVEEQTVRHTLMLPKIDEIHTAQQLLKDEIARKVSLTERIFIIPSWKPLLHRSSRTESYSSLSSMLRLVMP